MDKQIKDRKEFLENLMNVVKFLSTPSKLKKILTKHEYYQLDFLLKFGIEDTDAVSDMDLIFGAALEATYCFLRETK